MTTLKNLRIYLPDHVLENGYITFDEHIRDIGTGDIDGIDMHQAMLVPGFIDQHIHGVSGHDAMDASLAAYERIATMLPKEGTTAFLATTMTDSKENILHALTQIRTYHANQKGIGAELLGVHLEGPFISPVFKGAQREDAIERPSIAYFDALNDASNHLIKLVTLAPEQKGALELIAHLKQQHIVPSIGHSNATDHEVVAAIQSGVLSFTHGFNAMSRLHHRDLGVVGMMLLDDTCYVEIIADGVHTSERAIQLLYKAKTSHRIILITDAMRAKLLEDGTYSLGGQDVFVHNHQARLQDGTLAGSVLRMIDAVKNMKKITGCGMHDLIRMASSNPAKLLGVDHRKGSIAIGMDADLVVLDDSLTPLETYCTGIKR